METGDATVPSYDVLMWPTVMALRELGGSGAISEVNEKVMELSDFSPEQQAVLHGDGPQTEIEYRLAWARTYLKFAGLAENSSRGVWTLTETGRSADEPTTRRLHVTARKARHALRMQRRRDSPAPADFDEEPGDDEGQGWRDELLELVMRMKPDAFERLAKRLLREAGFISVNVTGGSGDGGIDGLGVYRLSLVSFPVFFQCKRYRGSVTPSAVRDFRGAMAGRGDKGLLITTGTFTSEAKREATRDGAPPVDLIDGGRLCDLLKEYRLGVDTEVVEVEKISVRGAFFAEV